MNLSDQRPLKPPKSSQSDPSNRPAVPLPLPKPKKPTETRQSYAYEDTEPTKPRVGAKPLHAKAHVICLYYRRFKLLRFLIVANLQSFCAARSFRPFASCDIRR